MSLDALSSNDLFNFIIYHTIPAAPNANSLGHHDSSKDTHLSNEKSLTKHDQHGFEGQEKQIDSTVTSKWHRNEVESNRAEASKKRKRKPKACKNKEEAETQRMTHIAVERNRRKQMNEHLSVLRSLMPESYVQRGDQASIVGGAVEFVKELEHILSTLEAKKLQISQQQEAKQKINNNNNNKNEDYYYSLRRKIYFSISTMAMHSDHNHHHHHQSSTKSKTCSSSADIEVTLIETHANLRILSTRTHKQLLKLIAGLQSLHLTILHLNLTHFHPLVLYSFSLKVEEGCQLRTVDDIAAAAHHIVRIIEEEGALCQI